MSRLCLVAALIVPVMASASWYWPFGSDDDAKPRRVSELMEPASKLIDKASDLVEDGKIDEAIEEYRKALQELNRIEIENPERADKPEFSTLRNKRAYVNSAIDSLLLDQARRNATAVAITDTTELEKMYAGLVERRRAARSGRPMMEMDDATRLVEEGVVGSEAAKGRQSDRRERLKRAMAEAEKGNDAAALAVIDGLLAEKPNSAGALNLKAKIEMGKGDLDAAEKTLDQCIRSNPRSYYAFYNMARVLLKARKGEEGRKAARKYYKMGRDVGGPVDAELEGLRRQGDLRL